MKKLLIITFSILTIYTTTGEECTLASQNTKNYNNGNYVQKLYNYKSTGQQSGYSAVYYHNGRITKIETRDNGGKRLGVSKR